jgi:hypothetical protein
MSANLLSASRARITGLTNSPQLNGEVCELKFLDREKGRWSVQLYSDTRTLLVRSIFNP